MRLVVIESPLMAPSSKIVCTHGEQGCCMTRHMKIEDELLVRRNYLIDAMADSLKRGEAPYASHRLFPGVLDDDVPEQRKLGMEAGFAWGAKADLVAVYTDLGISGGMEMGIELAKARGQAIEMRSLPKWSR